MKEVEELIKLAKEYGVKELSYELKDKKIAVKFPYQESAPSQLVQYTATQGGSEKNAPARSNKEATKNAGLHEITSPFVGTFYRSSNPNAAPFVKLGQKINKGDIVCIVEAMKIMNEIESDITGEVVEICAENENYVEFGQALFRIRP